MFELKKQKRSRNSAQFRRGFVNAVVSQRGFTLIELMVVISVIVITLSFLIPALAPGTARSLEGAARQFTADLENARQIAIAERTKTRVLIPDTNGNTPSPPFPTEIGLRGYAIVSFNRTAGTWKQRGKWNRLALPAVFDPNVTADPVDPKIEESVITKLKSEVTKIDNTVSGTGASNDFKGAYIEFHPNGSTSLDPTSLIQVLMVADGIADGNGGMTPKNKNLHYRITIDPLTGSTRLK